MLSSDQTILEKTERYINGQMTTEEQLSFEEKIKSDAIYSKVVNEYIEFFEALNHFAENNEVKSVLNEIHSEIQPAGKIIALNSNSTGGVLIRSITYRMIGRLEEHTSEL